MLFEMKNQKNFFVDAIFIVIGCFIASLGVNLFLSNAKLLSGGATGIALIFEYLANIPAGLTILIINIPLFFISYKYLSKRFTLYSAVGMLSLSVSLMITKPFSYLVKVDEMLFYCIYGGLLTGLGYGIVFLRNGSTGGIDIITMFIRRYHSHLEIGKLGFTINLLIVVIGAYFFGLTQALYTLISVFIQGVVVDRVVNGFTSKKLLLILTEKEDNIIEYIIKDMHRGVTSLPAEGEYTHSKRKMIYCVVTSTEMISLKRKILRVDPNAFITVIQASEINGQGFKPI